MRHRKRHSKLSMKTSRRTATMRNMAASLLKSQRIKTVLARAKEVRRLVEKLITLSKRDTVESRRYAYSILGDRDMVSKLFKDVAPLFKDRTSGYTRIIPLGYRRGDGAFLAILELTEKKIVEKLPKKKKEKAKEKEEPAAEKKGVAEEPKMKTLPKSKPTLEEEKRHEKAKSEDMKVADKRSFFMKNLRGLFRKRGDR
jgi:large subunit ribosomal protein L17